MVKTTLKQLGKRFNPFYMASDVHLNIWSFWNTELQRVQVIYILFFYCLFYLFTIYLEFHFSYYN